MNRMILSLATMTFIATHAAFSAGELEPFPLWPGAAPGALGTAPQDIPTLKPFLVEPTNTTSTAAILVCPGGGYANLTAHEGDEYARWFNAQGMSAFVLKYRLGSKGYRHPAMINDASRAMRIIRSRAAEWKVDASRIGIIGSSAGGHLASTLLTHYDRGDSASTDTVEQQSCRPDFGILVYAVISFGPKGHVGSMENLLGKNPREEIRRELSNELHVDRNTPPTFLFHTADDSVVKVENSLLFADALASADVPFALHVYPHGAHGLGLGRKKKGTPTTYHPWTTQLALWLKDQGFAPK